MSDRLDGLEIAVQLRNHATENPLAALLWTRLIYSADPDREAEKIAAELKPLLDAALAVFEAAGPALRIYYDVAGPN